MTWMLCDVCGHDGTLHRLTCTARSGQPLECVCSFCQGLIDAGFIRPEGDRRYRRWSFEWTPGELLPPVGPDNLQGL